MSTSPTIDQNLAKALAHPMRVRILEALQGRTASPSELAREFLESIGVVSYHANALRDVGCIEQVRTKPNRGTVEHFYTARPRSFIGHQDWRRAPVSVRGGVTSEAIRTFIAKVGAALDADTIDSREDTILHWASISVDEEGRAEISQIFDRALVEVAKAAGRSRERLGHADGIPFVTGLAAFEAAPGPAAEDPSAETPETVSQGSSPPTANGDGA
jgi:DNA-binding transcriptional ArsR family regulator